MRKPLNKSQRRRLETALRIRQANTEHWKHSVQACAATKLQLALYDVDVLEEKLLNFTRFSL